MIPHAWTFKHLLLIGPGLFLLTAGSQAEAQGIAPKRPQKATHASASSVAAAAESAPEPSVMTRLLQSLRHLEPEAGSAEPKVIRNFQDATLGAPNAWLRQWSDRRLGILFLRGVGGAPVNPYVTTYLDGVPQIHGYSANVELLDVEQITLVPASQGGIGGRNSLGGELAVTSRRPSLTTFQGEMESTFGNYNLHDFRGRVSGPLIQDQLGFSFAGGYQERDGFSENPFTGNDLDFKSARFGKAQFLWTPDPALEVRLIVAGESSRDGDDAFNELSRLRQNPYRASARDLEGHTHRDVLQPTLQISYHADAFDLTSTTGYVWWQTEDLVDFDRSTSFPTAYVYWNYPFPDTYVDLDRTAESYVTRRNREEQRTITQEFRLSNPAERPVVLADSVKLGWQAGAFFHHTVYEQQADTHRAAVDAAAAPPGFRSLPEQTVRHRADVVTTGIGAYLQTTLSFRDRLQLTTGLRWDYERQRSDPSELLFPAGVWVIGEQLPRPYFTSPLAAADSHVQAMTPQASLSYRITADLMTYVSFAGGSQSQATFGGIETGLSFSHATSWNYEWGIQGRAWREQVRFRLNLFYSDLNNLQVNVEDPWLISATRPDNRENLGTADASAYGLETALVWHPLPFWQLYGNAGLTQATYRGGSRELSFPYPSSISGNQLPYSPDYTAAVGTLLTWRLGHGLSLYAGADVQFIGPYHFDATNGAGQEAFTLTDFRLGFRHKSGFVEAFAHNAFDTRYVSSAARYWSSEFSGPDRYLGESGPPATFGIRAGLRF